MNDIKHVFFLKLGFVFWITWFVPSFAENGVIVKLSTTVDQTNAEKFLTPFVQYLTQQTTIPLTLTFQTNEKEAYTQIKSNQFQFALVCFGFYLRYHEELNLHAQLQEIPKNPKHYTYFLLTPKSKYASLADFWKQEQTVKITSLHAKEQQLLRRIAFGYTIAENFEFHYKPFSPRNLGKMESGEYSAILMNGKEYVSLPTILPDYLTKIDVYEGTPQIGTLLVTMGEGEISKSTCSLIRAFENLSKVESAKSYLDTMEVQEFKAVKDEDFHELFQIYHKP